MSLSAVDELTARAVLDPRAWLKRYTPAAVPAKYARHHRRLCELPEPGEAQARVVYRGAAKTTVTRGLVLWAVEHGHARGVLWVRANGADTKADRESIKRVCDARGIPYEVDGDQGMIVVNDVPIWGRTPGGAVRGIQWVHPTTGAVIRPDLLIVDDLETRETARSPTQTKVIQDWLTSDAMQTADQAHPMRTILLGTPITPNCLVAKAMRREAPFDTWAAPLVVPIVDEHGVPAWPAQYNPALEATVPEITWATEYKLETLPPGRLYFPRARTVWLDELPRGLKVWIGIDPAGDGNDATGMAAVALDDALGLVVVAAEAWEGLASQMPLQVARFVREIREAGHRIAGVLFEANKGAWQWPAREVRDLLAPIPVQTEPPTTSKGERAIPVQLWHQRGLFAAAADLEGSTFDLEHHSFTLDEQTVTGHDDVTDAVCWAAGVATKGHTVKPPDVDDAL